jgi:hypothetical protein
MSATFVVEDGSASSTATSYVSVADADTYIANYVRSDTAWTGLADADKQDVLVEATQSVELLYGGRFIGSKYTEAQALAFPRSGVVLDGFSISTDIIPDNVQNAVIEMAWRHLADDGPDSTSGDSTGIIPDLDNAGDVSAESVSVGSVKTSTEYLGGKGNIKRYRKVDLLLRPLLKGKHRLERA